MQARAETGDDLVLDRVGPAGPLGHGRLACGTGAEDGGRLAGQHLVVPEVDHDLVHRDAADERAAPTPQEVEPAPPERRPSLDHAGDDSAPGYSHKRPAYRVPEGRPGSPDEPYVPYAELHVHSDFSFLDGASDPESLIEEAARLRDDIEALRKAMEKNAVVLADATDADLIALAEDELEAAVQIFHVRGGRVRGQRGWVTDKVEEVTTADLVEALLSSDAGAVRETKALLQSAGSLGLEDQRLRERQAQLRRFRALTARG